MAEKYIICVDLGTMGTKAAVVSTKGQILAKTVEESKLYYPKPGWVEQKPEEIYSSTVNTIKKVIKDTRVNIDDIAAIGISGQMAGIMGIDEDGNAATHYDSWLDNRCEKYVDVIKEKGEDKYIQKNGMPATIAHAAKVLWWKNEKPETFERIAKFVPPGPYVAGRLAGLDGKNAYVDYSYLHFSGIYDAEKMEWSEEMAELLEIPLSKFPDIVKPWDIIGELTSQAAEECGLKPGIPVVAGAGDTAVSFLGTGLTEPGVLVDIAGTASVFSCCVDDFRPDLENKTLLFPRSILPEYWYSLSYIGGGGLCLRWFRDTFALEEKERAKKEGISTYDILNNMAEEVLPGSDGLLFLPHLAGRTYPVDSKVKGTWVGFSWSHGKAHFYRSILESIAYEYRFYFKKIKDLFPEIDYSEVRVIGGGSKSKLWNQIKADVLGIPYVQINEEDVSLIGLAMTAAKGVGLVDDLASSISKIIETTARYEPRKEYTDYYVHYADLYEQLFENFNPTFNEISNINNIPNPQD